MAFILIDSSVLARIALVRKYAEAPENVYTVDDLLDIYNAIKREDPDLELPSKNPLRTCVIPVNHVAVLTIETGMSGELIRHLGITVITPGPPREFALPNAQMVEHGLLYHFGFIGTLDNCYVKLHDNQAHIYQPVDYVLPKQEELLPATPAGDPPAADPNP